MIKEVECPNCYGLIPLEVDETDTFVTRKCPSCDHMIEYDVSEDYAVDLDEE